MSNMPWVASVRGNVDERLRGFLHERRCAAKAASPEGSELIDALSELTLRGGKRLRPIVTYAGANACQETGWTEAIGDVGVALELLQAYLLIHDDWMDQDDERRGGPSVHAALRSRHPEHLANSLAILAGDLAGTLAWEAYLAAEFPENRRSEANQLFIEVQKEVFLGQHLDLIAHADVERMHQLKTGSYTVRGPLLMGALIGDATPAQTDALLQYGEPMGAAFQVRDDILGTFGDPSRTGKPAGNDIRAGKHNAIVDEAKRRLSSADYEKVESVLRKSEKSDQDVAQVISLFESCGAKESLEAKLEALLEQAVNALEGADFCAAGSSQLRDLAQLLTLRDR
jgi:geranylgeranyl diphosphate synthase type I